MSGLPEGNVDHATVRSFGDEWNAYDQSRLSDTERRKLWNAYFQLFPWSELPVDAQGFDAGCGTGRWALLVAERVGRLHCVDASASALAVARRTLAHRANCEFHVASVDEMPFPDGSMDFGYSLGVLHHLPDPLGGLRSCVAKLKPGAPMLLYLYYAFDNRPRWFRHVWRVSELLRRRIASLPHPHKVRVTRLIALTVYLPLARTAGILERAGADVSAFPLSFYRHLSLYSMQTDALDRFGTPLEHRFTAAQVVSMMEAAGLGGVRVRDGEPFWCAVGVKR